MFYPVSDLLNPVTFLAPPSVPKDGALPKIVLLGATEVRQCMRTQCAHQAAELCFEACSCVSGEHLCTSASCLIC